MSIDVLIWLLLFGCLLLGAPVFVSLGLATFIALNIQNVPLNIIPLDLYKVSGLFPLLAVPCFIFAGALMEKGGMAEEIISIAQIFVGRMTGGLALTAIAGCIFFAAMIGSGPATTAAMGALMIPSMVKRGYDKDYSAAVCSTGGTLGILIPPSNPLIVYGVAGNISISALFMAGFVPGFFVGLCLMVTAYVIARKRGYKGDDKVYTLADLGRTLKTGIFSLFTPILVLGGIYSGIFTPVEASVVTVFYAFLVGTFINKKITVKNFWEACKMTNISTGTVLIVVGLSTLFGRFLTMFEVPQKVAVAITSISTDPFIVLLILGAFLFFLGMFMESLATIVIITPVVLPLLVQVGINPIHFGIVLIMTNEIGMLTPPLGVNLFVAMNLTGLTLETMSKAVLPFIGLLVALTIIVMRFEEMALILPRLLGIIP